MADYQEFKTPSGVVVQVRQRTYTEWEEVETDRLVKGDALIELRATTPEKAIVQEMRNITAHRERNLSLWVKDWPKVKKGLVMGDIAAIEKHCRDAEYGELVEKN